jgi:hypothetical protein
MQLSAEEFARRISNENYAWWLANNKKPLEWTSGLWWRVVLFAAPWGT